MVPCFTYILVQTLVLAYVWVFLLEKERGREKDRKNVCVFLLEKREIQIEEKVCMRDKEKQQIKRYIFENVSVHENERGPPKVCVWVCFPSLRLFTFQGMTYTQVMQGNQDSPHLRAADTPPSLSAFPQGCTK